MKEYQNRAFFDFIDPCPVECYKYKWPDGTSTNALSSTALGGD